MTVSISGNVNARGLAVAGLLAFGCGPPAEVKGNVAGYALHAQAALFSDPMVRRDSTHLLWIVISDVHNYCDLKENDQEVANSTELELSLRRNDGQAFGQGEYQVVSSERSLRCSGGGENCPTLNAVAALRRHDNQCSPLLSIDQGEAVSGSVVLKSVRAGQWVDGTFELDMGQSRDHLSGLFQADACSQLLRWRPDRAACGN